MKRALLLLLAVVPGGRAAEPAPAFQPGVVYHYVKSNLDGSDPWHVATARADRTEPMDPFQWQAFRAEALSRFILFPPAPAAPSSRADGGQR